MAIQWQRHIGSADSFMEMRTILAAGCICILGPLPCQTGAANDRAGPVSPPDATNRVAHPSLNPKDTETTTNSTTVLPAVTVTADLDRAREEIAPSLGAVTYTIGPNQIETMSQGESSSFQQVLLHAPGVVQEEFGRSTSAAIMATCNIESTGSCCQRASMVLGRKLTRT